MAKSSSKNAESVMPVTPVAESQIEESPITKLDPKMQRFVHLYLSGQYTVPQLAQLLDVHYQTTRNWLRNPIIRQVIEDYQKDEHYVVQTGLKALTMKALDKLGKLIDSPIDGVALQAVNTALDRGGHKLVQEKKIDIKHTTFEKQIKSLAEAFIDDAEVIDLDEIEE